MTFKVTYTSQYNISVKSLQPNDYKASFPRGVNNSQYNISVKASQPNNYKTSFYRSITPMKLDELADVQISSNSDKYVLMYDSTSGKWIDVNPDIVLNAAASTETTQPGLPNVFLNTLDVDLDDKIDLDAGTF